MKMTKKKEDIELRKFDPPIKPRYFPGQVSPNNARVDFLSYKSHRLDVENMKAVVDNKPPRFEIDIYYNREKLALDKRRAKMNYKENLQVAKNINITFRMGGKVDCWNFKNVRRKSDRSDKETLLKRAMVENKALYEKVNSLTSEYSPQVMAKQWKIVKQQIETLSKYPWFKEVSQYPSITQNAIEPANSKGIHRPRYFFDLEIEQSKLPLGRIVFELYNDYVPSVCANFEAFCKGHNGLSYKNTPFHRVLSGYWCQGGDVAKFNGLGKASITEDRMPNENFTLQHTCPGVLSTWSEDLNVADCKFNLTFRPLRTMDGKRVVFGKVVKGLQNLFKVEAYGTKFGKPLQKIIISNCGELLLEKRNSAARHSNQSK